MTYQVRATVIDNSLADPKPTSVEFTVSDWRNVVDQLLMEYGIYHRGGRNNVDPDRIELRSVAVICDRPL